MNSVDTENEEGSFDNYYGVDLEHSVFSVPGGLDPWLLPIQLPLSVYNTHDHAYLRRGMINGNYNAAVKHLDLALESSPTALAALSPLVQLLMVGGKVKQALSVVEKFCQNANTTIPFRLPARILDRSDCTLISSCYEDVLKNDPTCRYSLRKLIMMHQNEDYSPELLVEMISLHLDATYGDVSIYGKSFLAACSSSLNAMKIECRVVLMETKVEFVKVTPFFTAESRMYSYGILKSAKSWIFRCKWWLRRHFGEKMVLSEIYSRNLPLPTYKAACVCHLYGQSHKYVMKVRHFLEQEDGDMRMFLLTHLQNSVGFYAKFSS